ncbi:MAG TPA: hypothetical protein PLK08_07930 [Phycisphaerae bacterium]|nr:hypothetical protein [Phycisphaerae bacterium]
MKRYVSLMLLIGLAGLVGCDGDQLNMDYTTPAQKEIGMIYILPGIQGVDYHYKNIRTALIGSGINMAVMIHPWGCQIPGINLMLNETDTRDDRSWGAEIAQGILQYQQQYPDKPVYMIGQSGGCAVSIFAAETLASLPGAKPLQGIILLDASVSSDYDLTKAMSMCKFGIVNFYNPDDVALLEVGTAVFGNLDGGHGSSAGRVGFSGRYAKLFQVKIKKDMVDDFANPHFADCSKAFTAQYIAPWIIDQEWPPAYITYAKD